MGFLTAQTVKKFEFQKSTMADSRHFENRKIGNRLPHFDEIWHGDAYWPLQRTDR